jgi:hypothetical protein
MTSSWQGNRPMTAFGLAVLAALVIYVVFMVLNGFWLEQRAGTARVTNKGVLKGGKTYYTRMVDGRPLVMSVTAPEAYLLDLDLEGEPVQAVVPQATFEAVQPESKVEVVYERRRLTGGIVAREVRPVGKEDR